MTSALFSFVFAAALTPELAVRFEGNHQVPDAVLNEAVDRGGGVPAIVNDEGLDRAGQWVLAAYYDRGFVEARVNTERVRTENGHTATAVFHVFEGPVYSVGSVRIEGDTRGVVPRLPPPGSVLNRSAIMQALEPIRQRYREAGDGEIDVAARMSLDHERHTIDLKLEVRRP